MEIQITSSKKYTNMISASGIEFTRRFGDFQKLSELIDLRRDITLKEKFKSESIEKFYASLNESKFINLRKMAMKLLVLFWSTYICEQTLSTINIKKTELVFNLTDIHVHSLLRISTSNMEPEFEQFLITLIDHKCLINFK
ncbi:EPM2A-interacting protein 1 [Thelohanellus kitauei]|uniref:EPM2A-interacting protein 1 n=1 Tax=Thelohanellus kitauei TaxID=669202 RepID=A0A0C2J0Q9_THEKT|nr:EPM2A-interacting protein 1 [Thelohanellus kitauei]